MPASARPRSSRSTLASVLWSSPGGIRSSAATSGSRVPYSGPTASSVITNRRPGTGQKPLPISPSPTCTG